MQIDNPAFNYEKSVQYAAYRQTEPVIQEYINRALGNARTVLNVGAGAGSYEPEDRYVVAVEPSAAMRLQRRPRNKVPAINATASHLPFDDHAFDAAMALLTVHHWPDIDAGLKELRRVTKENVVIMSFDPDALTNFWNAEYFPELIEVEKARYPTIEWIRQSLGGKSEVVPVAIPLDCVDGFQEAFYGRPEAFLQPEVRRSQSAWSFLPGGLEDELVRRLEIELRSGAWDEKYGHYRTTPGFTGALRLVVATPE